MRKKTIRNPNGTTKTYYGEEAESVTLKDCQAANMLAAKMLAGQIDPMSIVTSPPSRKPVVVEVED